MTTTHALRHWLTGRTRRFHTSPSEIAQNNADHSWGVTMLVDLLYPDASANLLRLAIRHDMGEADVGDIAAPAKWKNRDLALMTACLEQQSIEEMYPEHYLLAWNGTEGHILKSCDMLELCMRAAFAVFNGNGFAREIFFNGKGALLRMEAPIPVLRVLEGVEAEWIPALRQHVQEPYDV